LHVDGIKAKYKGANIINRNSILREIIFIQQNAISMKYFSTVFPFSLIVAIK
jgi:hypothetical protein